MVSDGKPRIIQANAHELHSSREAPAPAKERRRGGAVALGLLAGLLSFSTAARAEPPVFGLAFDGGGSVETGVDADDLGTYQAVADDEGDRPPVESRRVRLAAPFPAEQYLFFQVAQTHHLGWQQGDPDSFTRDLFDDFLERLEPVENSALKAGFSYTFSVLQDPPETLVESLEALLALSEETGVPVQIHVDGQNWWGGRPDLWNWWDPDAPGYDPANRFNVEWTDWTPDSAVKIGWRNWGSQLRVLPEPNLMSPDFVEATLEGVRPLAATVASWWEGLPDDRKHLFGGFRVGWETSIGVNSYYYQNGNAYLDQDPADDPTYGRDHSKGLFAGLQPIGHAALTTAGIKTSGEITREDVAEVVYRHLATLSKAASEEGIPRHLLFTHQGGTYSPWEKHLPFRPAINEWSTPGWSFYEVDPRTPPELDRAMEETGREAWAAVEWLWSGGRNSEAWRDHFERTLGWRNCRFLTVYNWNPHIRDTPEGLAAREAARRMMEDRVRLPPQDE